jgi:hypothetical protein
MSDNGSVHSAGGSVSTAGAGAGAGAGGSGVLQTLPHLTKEWMRLEAEVAALSAEVKMKRRRIKETRAMILQIMRGNALGQLGTSAGNIVRQEKATKAAISNKYLRTTLVDFFEGDAVRANACAAWIESHRPLRTTENLTIQPKE